MLPLDTDLAARLTLTRMPSTSPAHASLSLQEKIDAWGALKTALEVTAS